MIAVLLTYFAVGLAYSSLALKELLDKPEGATASVSTTQAGGAAQPAGAAITRADAYQRADVAARQIGIPIERNWRTIIPYRLKTSSP